MKYYKNSENQTTTADRLEHEALIPAGYTEITEAEYNLALATIPNKLAELAAYRFAKETAGITINGAIIRTDLESQAMINGAVAYANLNPTALIDWKAANGWVQIDKDTVIAVGNAVGAHVQACYSRERVHAEAIAALTTPAEILVYDFTTGWPE
ncbi:MAG: DUF4376 domain-containing protein [Smithella sp.]